MPQTVPAAANAVPNILAALHNPATNAFYCAPTPADRPQDKRPLDKRAVFQIAHEGKR